MTAATMKALFDYSDKHLSSSECDDTLRYASDFSRAKRPSRRDASGLAPIYIRDRKSSALATGGILATTMSTTVVVRIGTVYSRVP